MTINFVKNRFLCYGCCIGFMVGFLTGCDEGTSDLEKFVNQVKQREPMVLPPPPWWPPVEHVTYFNDGRRDPFKPIDWGYPPPPPPPPGSKGITCPEHPDGPKYQYRVRGLLERIPLDAFEMVGTIKEGPGHILKGLVKTKGGTVYQVHQGQYFGKNYGKILYLSEQKIEVQERFRNKKTCWTAKVTTLPLRATFDRKLHQNSPFFDPEN